MTRRPEDDPIGAKPTLPAPNPAAVKRAQPLFAKLLSERRAASAEEPTRVAPRPVERAADLIPEPPRRTRTGGVRRYDAALALIESMAGPVGGDDAEEDPHEDEAPSWDAAHEPEPIEDDILELSSSHIEPLHEEDTAVPGEEPPQRPPPFAPTIRPSPPARRGRAAIDDEALSSMADAGMLIAEPDGSASFEIAFNDEVFSELACKITFKDGGVTATFRVPDANTRRLLEAEAGRLRVQLEERGLRVQQIVVEVI